MNATEARKLTKEVIENSDVQESLKVLDIIYHRIENCCKSGEYRCNIQLSPLDNALINTHMVEKIVNRLSESDGYLVSWSCSNRIQAIYNITISWKEEK